MPGEGVYACVVTDGRRAWPAAANVGAPPTFSTHRDAFLEANLLGFSGDLYDRELAVLFVSWLRASRPFSSLDELERVVLGNIAWVAENVGAHEVEVAP
jgi:riboflavin kinase/FMN adenylyltransferase